MLALTDILHLIFTISLPLKYDYKVHKCHHVWNLIVSLHKVFFYYKFISIFYFQSNADKNLSTLANIYFDRKYFVSTEYLFAIYVKQILNFSLKFATNVGTFNIFHKTDVNMTNNKFVVLATHSYSVDQIRYFVVRPMNIFLTVLN